MKNRLTDNRLQDYIHEVLIRRPDLRDSDSRLITHIWHKEAIEQHLDLKTLNAFDLLKLLQAENFTSTESIQRCRRKIQEQHPETRGKKYHERHSKSLEVKEFYKKEAA